jgi:hypothetical protein
VLKKLNSLFYNFENVEKCPEKCPEKCWKNVEKLKERDIGILGYCDYRLPEYQVPRTLRISIEVTLYYF